MIYKLGKFATSEFTVNELFPIFCSKRAYYILNSSVKNELQGNVLFLPNVESAVVRSQEPFPLVPCRLGGWIPGNPRQPGEPGAQRGQRRGRLLPAPVRGPDPRPRGLRERRLPRDHVLREAHFQR